MFYEGMLTKIAKTEARKVRLLQMETIGTMNVKEAIEDAKETARGHEKFFAFGGTIIKELCKCFSSLAKHKISQETIRDLIEKDPSFIDFMFDDCISALTLQETGSYMMDTVKVNALFMQEDNKHKMEYIRKIYHLLQDKKEHQVF